MNLRGVIVPIIDLRLVFGISDVTYDVLTCLIVLSVKGRVFGAVVDGVSEVLEITQEHLRETPAIGSGGGSASIMGIASVGERMLILLDIARVAAGLDIGGLSD